jgi:hypothetical protein
MRQVFEWETEREEYCRLGKVGNGRQKDKSECKGEYKDGDRTTSHLPLLPLLAGDKIFILRVPYTELILLFGMKRGAAKLRWSKGEKVRSALFCVLISLKRQVRTGTQRGPNHLYFFYVLKLSIPGNKMYMYELRRRPFLYSSSILFLIDAKF